MPNDVHFVDRADATATPCNRPVLDGAITLDGPPEGRMLSTIPHHVTCPVCLVRAEEVRIAQDAEQLAEAARVRKETARARLALAQAEAEAAEKEGT